MEVVTTQFRHLDPFTFRHFLVLYERVRRCRWTRKRNHSTFQVDFLVCSHHKIIIVSLDFRHVL
ncbi:Uncharacterized protein APZ42_015441 [Daphnia magna]|uniref:Uncharacterized protein n=1 Tax=Daphnia magna TaxID=35525 RepID=A0A162PGX6_9CRUS|nr:Uncharacterized protein APZ42_015441 [Daphnia magna]